ncbi:hypothetical protein AMATHDRAFT_134299 [Amanita thiersii Skay4041]|uniref:Uncharacterized protein n=1 Tax=Amanita thiersii Skay4041 TaxID=703135 RepID=A0A2A9P1V7_9AGAR|nr:hypothetical protein AMATHDRAFT_134299 [Amanita thiersii Skay4041]
MSLAPSPSPSASRGQLVLQPNYFSSSLYVIPLRNDISTLIHHYHLQYSLFPQNPFALFKRIWLSHGWKWFHLKVYDAPSRQSFLNITLRLFLERTDISETLFTRTAALFGFYTLFYTQPLQTAPPLYSVSHVPIPIDDYRSLRMLPSLLATPDLLPLQPFSIVLLSLLLKDDVFYILPSSTVWPHTPRQLPREQVSMIEGRTGGEEGKRKRGRPSREEKERRRIYALERLDKWLETVKP